MMYGCEHLVRNDSPSRFDPRKPPNEFRCDHASWRRLLVSNTPNDAKPSEATGADTAHGASGGLTGPAYPMMRSLNFQLRPFVPADIRQLVALAGEHRIANTTIGTKASFASDCSPEDWSKMLFVGLY